MQKMSHVVGAVIIAALLLVAGFIGGMQYQKSQPVKVDIISYSGNNITNLQTFLYPVPMGQITMISDENYFWDRNVSFYGILIRPT